MILNTERKVSAKKKKKKKTDSIYEYMEIDMVMKYLWEDILVDHIVVF